MKNFKLVALALLLTVLAGKTYSQAHLSAHFGVTSPTSDFVIEDLTGDKGKGEALALGWNAGIQYEHPFFINGLSLFGSLDFTFNQLSKKTKDDYEKLLSAGGLLGKIEHPKFINIPLVVGAKYTFKFSDKIAVFADGGLAFNFLNITDSKVGPASFSHDLANGMGFKVGAGFLISEHISLSANYFNLAKSDINTTTEVLGISSKTTEESKIEFLSFTLGFQF